MCSYWRTSHTSRWLAFTHKDSFLFSDEWRKETDSFLLHVAKLVVKWDWIKKKLTKIHLLQRSRYNSGAIENTLHKLSYVRLKWRSTIDNKNSNWFRWLKWVKSKSEPCISLKLSFQESRFSGYINESGTSSKNPNTWSARPRHLIDPIRAQSQSQSPFLDVLIFQNETTKASYASITNDCTAILIDTHINKHTLFCFNLVKETWTRKTMTK